MRRPIVIAAGYLVRYPLGGHLMSQYNYLAGLTRLGYEVIWLEHYGWPNACYDPQHNITTDDPSYGLRQVVPFLNKLGIQRWCYVEPNGTWHGLQADEVRRSCRKAEFVISLAATTWLEELRECSRRIFVDVDPGFTQFKMSPVPTPSCAGYASPYDFNFYFTAGERVGKPDCPIPTHGLQWHPLRQPLALDLVQPRFTPHAARFTTVMSWTAYGSCTYGDCVYGQKDVEMQKFLDLPQRAGKIFEIALGGVNAPTKKLEDAGWVVSEAVRATMTVEAYLDFIGNSRGEFSVAKEGYVKTRSGWFSDRTVVYLASGKPAIVQDTGFSEVLPTGEGLFAFRTSDDVLAAVDAIHSNYSGHCRAARRIAEEYFDSDKLFRQMLATCGVSVPRSP